jgi:hypothetical protein
MEPPQDAQLVTEDRVGAGSALLDSTNVQGSRFEVDLLPAKVNQLGGRQTMPKGQPGSWLRHEGPPAVCPWSHQPVSCIRSGTHMRRINCAFY